ncbi:unnamed protein product [Lathyrus sativus]|nr:unnamed protein product [Lathyrus sativus]
MSMIFPPDEDGPYIEIELDHAGDSKNSCMHDKVEVEHGEECELRISISSTISVSLQKESKSVDSAAEVGLGPSMIRKQPSLTTPTSSNGIMVKLMIKFRRIKIRSFIASLMKPAQNFQTGSSKKSITFFQCYEEDSISASLRKSRRRMDMDLGAFKGVFNAIGMSRRRSKRRSDASTSCNSTPTHEGFSKDNSIQGAIAYCKSSFGQTSDFTFSSSITSTPTRFVGYHD